MFLRPHRVAHEKEDVSRSEGDVTHSLTHTKIIMKWNLAFVRNVSAHVLCFNLKTPNVNYSWRTAPLTSKVAFYIFIQQI